MQNTYNSQAHHLDLDESFIEVEDQSNLNIIQDNNIFSNLVLLSSKAEKKNKSKKSKKQWKHSENLKYIEFLEDNRQLYQFSREEKRLNKINVQMSQFIGTRSSIQCRSHHQKMMKHHKSIDAIIEYFLKEDSEEVAAFIQIEVVEAVPQAPLAIVAADLEEEIWNFVSRQCWTSGCEEGEGACQEE